jgi:asparagine synthase (glutamine-hydrolysing)
VVYDHLIPDEERYYASIAADALGIPIDYQVADDYHPYQGWDSPEFQLPEPAHELFYAKSYERLQRVARHSRVALCGHGGDEALSGATVMNMLQTMPLKDVLFDIGYSLFGYRIQPSWGSGLLAFVRNWRRKEVDQNECPDWINSNFFNRLSLNERWEEIMGEQKHSQHLPRHRAYEKFASPLWASHLEQKDPQFWAVPVEVRHPFLDLRLLNYLLALPPLPWCVDKALLRIAMKQSLPEEVRRRPKAPLAGDPLTVKGFQDVDQEHIWQLLSGIDEYVNADQIRGESRQGGVWRTWQHLCPVSLAYWLNSSLKAARASPALPLD